MSDSENKDDLKTVRIQMVMSPSDVSRIDDWGFKHRIRSRSEVIRTLAELAIDAGLEPKKP